tara:strand:+ start:579 stop:1646 length:1068 start_codon:yes stop_codon:yes gene_type:complete
MYYKYKDFISQISKNASQRNDLVVPLNSVSLGKYENNVYINGELYHATDTFHTHLAQRLDIPMPYYRKMLSNSKKLLQTNVNHWLNSFPSNKQVLLRSYIEPNKESSRFLRWNSEKLIARGLLSNRYKIMDNNELFYDLQYIIDDFEVKSVYHNDEITNVKIQFPKLEGEIRKGDVVTGGIVLRNSELGFSSISATSLIYRLVCDNGMMLPNVSAINSKYHIGKPITVSKFSSKSIKQDYELPENLTSDICDMMIDMQDEVRFKHNLQELKDTTKRKFTDINYTFLRREYNTSVSEEKEIKDNLEISGDYTQYGLIQAITATARELKNIQRSIHLERLGGKLLYITNQQWGSITI